MAISKNRQRKPTKPSKYFLLTAHNSGQWCNKNHGEIHFFGTWEEPQAAWKITSVLLLIFTLAFNRERQVYQETVLRSRTFVTTISHFSKTELTPMKSRRNGLMIVGEQLRISPDLSAPVELLLISGLLILRNIAKNCSGEE